jgi:hypothetical protein
MAYVFIGLIFFIGTAIFLLYKDNTILVRDLILMFFAGILWPITALVLIGIWINKHLDTPIIKLKRK